MWSYEQLFGGIIGVIVAGMPAMIALLKIRELKVTVNGRLTQLIESEETASYARGKADGLEQGRLMFAAEDSEVLDAAAAQAKMVLNDAALKARELLDRATKDIEKHRD